MEKESRDTSVIIKETKGVNLLKTNGEIKERREKWTTKGNLLCRQSGDFSCGEQLVSSHQVSEKKVTFQSSLGVLVPLQVNFKRWFKKLLLPQNEKQHSR